MAGSRQPIELIMSKSAKHLTKKEIQERMASEVKPCTDCITPPGYLTAGQKKRFTVLSEQLQKIGIMGETDSETLARYITAEELYQQAVRDIRAARKSRPDASDLDAMALWAVLMDKLDKRLDRYFKQAHTAASALGLTISSRCKLVVPKNDTEPKPNKFGQFQKASGNE